MVNNFLPFATGGGANVEPQSSYAADPLLPIGNQPGVAVSALNNKALRQGTVIASQIAQFMANKTGTDLLDDGNMVKLLAQMFATFDRTTPVVTSHLSGSGNHNLSYKFQVASANATVGATYSDGTTTFTVSATIAAGLELVATGPATPAVSGTLTKTSGTGDATIVFYAVRAPLFMRVVAVGGGGGGGGSGNSGAGTGGTGGTTTFGSVISCLGGVGGNLSFGAGGVPTISSPASGIALTGGPGKNSTSLATGSPGGAGGDGGINTLSGGGVGGSSVGAAVAGLPNSGGGGGGGNGGGTLAGSGGGSGSFVDVLIPNPLSQYSFAIGGGGTAGSAGSGGGVVGAIGGSGYVETTEYYQ